MCGCECVVVCVCNCVWQELLFVAIAEQDYHYIFPMPSRNNQHKHISFAIVDGIIDMSGLKKLDGPLLLCLLAPLKLFFVIVYTYVLMHTLIVVFDWCFVLLFVIVVFLVFYPNQCLLLRWCWYHCVLWSWCCIVCSFGLVWFLVPKSCGTSMVHLIPL